VTGSSLAATALTPTVEVCVCVCARAHVCMGGWVLNSIVFGTAEPQLACNAFLYPECFACLPADVVYGVGRGRKLCWRYTYSLALHWQIHWK